MKILVTGARGMLGRTLMRRLRLRHEVTGTDIQELDLSDAAATLELVRRVAPQAIINGAAMTQVDRCETERERAFAANATAAEHIARAARDVGARLVHLSTDYVFAGDLERPYHEQDEPAPRTVYGQSKLAGERAVVLACPDHTIVRTAWLYGPGGPDFVHTMLRLAAQPGGPLKVVDDQRGNPTSTDALAGVIEELLQRPLRGIVHATCEGEATWYEFAREIFTLAGVDRALVPCSTAEFPRPAPRPANSRLEKRALREAGFPPLPHWKTALARFQQEGYFP